MSIFQTYILYYLVILFTVILTTFSEKLRSLKFAKTSKYFFWLAIIFPVLVSGYRYGVGVDYFNYERIYYLLTNQYNFVSAILETRYEPSWIILNYLVKFIFDDAKYIFLISSFLVIFINFKALQSFKTSISLPLAMLIFFCTMYNPSFNIIRLSIAAAILMLSIKPLVEKKPLKFILTVLFAGSFHYTSIIFLPAYWIVNGNEYSAIFKRAFAIIGAITLIIFAQPILSLITNIELFSTYKNYSLGYGDIGFGNIILKLPVIIIILFNISKLKNSNNFSYRITILYFISLVLDYFSYLQEYAGRIALYFEMTQIFILSSIVNVQRNKYEKLIYLMVIILYFIALYTFEILINNGHGTIPYFWRL